MAVDDGVAAGLHQSLQNSPLRAVPTPDGAESDNRRTGWKQGDLGG
jgi:hypothetical protein